FTDGCSVCCCLVWRRPPSSTLFPYTTLFRSCRRIAEPVYHHISTVRSQFPGDAQSNSTGRPRYNRAFAVEHALFLGCVIQFAVRSEEHTSELQSRENLVCRLLLEKKKEK